MSKSYKQLALRHRDPAIRHLVQDTLPLARMSGAPKELVESLERALELSWRRLQYTEDSCSQPSPACEKLLYDTIHHDWLAAYEQGKTTWHLIPLMIAGHHQGQLLKSLISATGAKDVLEVGMFTGYSALSMAEGLPADGKILTIDQDEYLKEFFLSRIEDSPHKHKIEVKLGQAIDIMTKLADEGKSFDAIYLDARKQEYAAYFKLFFERNLLRPNGSILVDNAYKGKTAYTNPESRASKFTKFIRENPKLHVVLIPIRDGLFLIRRETSTQEEEKNYHLRE